MCAANARIVENTIQIQHYPLAWASWNRSDKRSSRSSQVNQISALERWALSQCIVFYVCLKARRLTHAWARDDTMGWYVNENGQQSRTKARRAAFRCHADSAAIRPCWRPCPSPGAQTTRKRRRFVRKATQTAVRPPENTSPRGPRAVRSSSEGRMKCFADRLADHGRYV